MIALGVLVAVLGTAALLDTAEKARPLGPPILRNDRQTGPVLDLSGDGVRSGHPDSVSVGLAFMGLPDDSAWPSISARLSDAGATATWFVSGREVRRRADDIRRIIASGGEVGVVGYTGNDLAAEPGWRRRFDLSVTQAALAARIDRTASLLMMPATPYAATLDRAAVRAARAAARDGYLLVVGTAVSDTMPGGVAVIRSTEDDAPEQLTSLLEVAERDDVDVIAVGQAIGLHPDEVNRRPGLWTRFNAWLVLAAVAWSESVVGLLPWLYFALTGLLTLRAVLSVGLGIVHAARRRRGSWTGPVSVVVPAYNEAAGIGATLRSLVASDWPHGLEIIVVDDGSTDGTADIAEELQLHAVRVIRQENMGKPGALNTGIAASTGEIVVLVDGDTVFEPGTIRALVGPFDNDVIGAVSGNAKVANRDSLLGTCQHLEYVMGFNLDRRMLDLARGIATIPGAVGAFRRTALEEASGLSDDTIAEDTDLTIAISRSGWSVAYRADAVAWTEAPSTVGDLWKQRYRWSYGVLQAVWKHRRALIEPRPIGPIGLTYTLVVQVVVGLLSPFVDAIALFALATGDRRIIVTWVGFVVVQLVMAAVALRLDRESLRPLWAVPLQQLFYRQLMYLVVIESLASAAAGVRLRWHKLHRVGIDLDQTT